MKVRIAIIVGFATLLAVSTAKGEEKTAQHEKLAKTILGEYEKMGFKIDGGSLKIEVKQPKETYGDLDRQQDIFFSPTYFDGQYALNRGLGLRSVKSPAAFRKLAVRGFVDKVSAYYQPDRDALVFINSFLGKLTSIEHVVAHELFHAYQDQMEGGIGGYLKTDGAVLEKVKVRHTLLEGYCELAALGLQLARVKKSLKSLEPEQFENPVSRLLAGEGIALTYELGSKHLLRAFKKGGWKAVDHAFRNPPTSSEQLLHIEKLGKDTPTSVTIPRIPELRGFAKLRHDDIIGELQIYSLLSLRYGERDEVFLAATGWDGDRLKVYQTGDGHWIAIWRSIWDRPEDAQQFERVMRKSYPRKLPIMIKRSGRVVDWVYDESDEVLIDIIFTLNESLPKLEDIPIDVASTAKIEAARLRNKKPSNQASTKAGRWVHKDKGISFPIPKGWETRNISGQEFLFAPTDEGFNANLNIMVQPNPTTATLDELLELNKGQIENLPGITLDEIEKRQVSGKEVIFLEYHGKFNENGPDLHFAAFLYLYGDNQVIVTSAVAESKWEALEPVIREMFKNVEFDDE